MRQNERSPEMAMIDSSGSNSGHPIVSVLNCNMPSKSFFRSLFHTREKAETPLVSFSEPEFPELVPVSYYHTALQSTAYISNPKINSHKVVELVRFKTTTRSGYRYKKQVHQQVVAKVETGEPGVYGYLCIERAQTRLCYNTLENLVSNSSPSIHFE